MAADATQEFMIILDFDPPLRFAVAAATGEEALRRTRDFRSDACAALDAALGERRDCDVRPYGRELGVARVRAGFLP